MEFIQLITQNEQLKVKARRAQSSSDLIQNTSSEAPNSNMLIMVNSMRTIKTESESALFSGSLSVIKGNNPIPANLLLMPKITEEERMVTEERVVTEERMATEERMITEERMLKQLS